MKTIADFAKLVTILVLCFFMAASVSADDEAVAEIGISTGGQAKMSPFGTSLSDPSASGLTTQSVNLYTGQHVESFPLLSIAGRGGLGIDLSLDYNGNVSRMAKAENRKAQASPFGLGFSMGLISIVADHKSTADITDDEYRLIFNDLQARLYRTDGNLYATEDAKPWVLQRDTATISGRLCVIGWTILSEDGTVYRLGDHDTDLSGWNATRALLRYGNFVGNGRTQDDTLHAFQWDLKRIQDSDSLNWIDFTYTWDERYLQVRNSAGDSVVNSLNAYTGASYLDKIETPDGAAIDFIYASRLDKQSYYGGYQYEFYAERQVDRLKLKDKDDSTISQIDLTMTYLNTEGDSTFRKLALREIAAVSADGTESLSRYVFDYHDETSDPAYGSIRRITNGSGAIKEIGYNTIADEANFAELDFQFLDTAESWEKLDVAGDIFLNRHKDSMWILGVWNGYWDTTSFRASGNEDDRAAISPDGWIAVPMSGDDILIKHWREGSWVTDTLVDAIDRLQEVRLYPGLDCFVAVSGTVYEASEFCGMEMIADEVKYFRWNDDTWSSYLVKDFDPLESWDRWYLECVRLRSDFFGVSFLWDLAGDCDSDNQLWLYACKYVESGDSLVIHGMHDPNVPANSGGRAVFTGHDYVGVKGNNSVLWSEWTGDSWEDHVTGETFGIAQGFAELPNGFIYNWTAGDTTNSHMRTMFADGDGFESIYESWGESWWKNAMAYIWGNNHSIITSRGDPGSSQLCQYSWDGKNWSDQYIINEDEPYSESKTTYMSDDCWVRGAIHGDTSTNISARRFLGHGVWSSPQSFQIAGIPSKDGFAATDDFLAYHAGDSKYRAGVYHPLYFGNIWHDMEIDSNTFEYEQALFKSGDRQFCRLVRELCRDTLYDTVIIQYAPFDTIINVTYSNFYFPWDGITVGKAYKYVDTLFQGKAPMLTVDSIVTYKSSLDLSPVIQNFAYYGGILDQSATTPRFSRVKASTPYYAGDSPDGYSVHFFYNDVDSAEFYNDTIFDSIPRAFLNLRDSRFGIDNGGFYLDGTEYLSYSYSVGDASSKMQDSSVSFYSVYNPIDSLPEIRRVRLDSTHVRQDSLCSDVSYVYDLALGFLKESWQKYKSDSTFLVSTQEYAYESDTAMENDNALSQVSLQKSQYVIRDGDNDTTLYDSTLSMSGSQYEEHAGWRAVRSHTWRNLNPPTDMLITSDVLPNDGSFDEYGNVLASTDVNGDTSGVKLDPDGLRTVAAIGKGFPDNCAFFDAEYPFDGIGRSHDGWEKYAEPYCYLSDSAVFTGTKGLRIWDDPNSYSYSMALSRVFHADSLMRDIYLLDFWSLSNGVTDGVAWQYSNGSGAVLVDSTSLNGDAESWQHQKLLVNIGGIANLDSIRVALLLNDSSGAYAYFDDVRFHPVDASISTTVYDVSTGMPLAKAGASNSPVNYEYDKLWRPTVTKDYDGNELAQVEYQLGVVFETVMLADTVDYPEFRSTYRADTAIAPCDLLLEYELSVLNENILESGSAKVFKNGALVDSAYCIVADLPGWCQDTARGTILVSAGDTIVIKVRGGLDELPKSGTINWRITALVKYSEAPNYVKTTSHRTISQSNVSVNYYDGFGKTVQQRVRDSVGGEEVSIVSGFAEQDARGRSTKSYLPFYDMLGSTGTEDYTMRDSFLVEIRDYYDEDMCPDCDTFVYSENAYASDLKSPLDSSGAPGVNFNLASGKVTKYEQYTDTTNEIYVSRTFAPDGRESRSYKDHWSESDSRITYYDDGQSTDSLVSTSYTPVTAKYSEQVIDTGNGGILLRQTFNNDLGLTDSTWKVDYGKIRMIYDNSGNIRFMMNERRRLEYKFVYFKYDKHGRKTEEGLMSNLTYFIQDSALSPTFPDAGASPDVRYRWYYDYHEVDSVVLLALGKLVRVENADSSYYRNYFYFPEDRSDSTVVKLPFTDGGSLKAIVHRHNRDGSKKELVVYPDLADSTTRRGFLYDYDAAGRLRSISRNTDADYIDSALVYGQFQYNADGSLRQADLGRHGDSGSFIQQVDYRYDALGRLVAINDTTDIFESDTLVGTDYDHFGQEIVYDSSSPDLIWKSHFAYSTSSGKAVFSYDYSYNDLGWLTEAKASSDLADSASQRFGYNALGQRKEMIVGDVLNLTDYTYLADTSRPGSSRLLWFTEMGNDTLGYDVLGNLVDDDSRHLDTMHYDYRNLLRYVYMPSTRVDSLHDVLRFEYNESGLRIKKVHHYWRLNEFPGLCPPVYDSVMEGWQPGGGMMMMIIPKDSIPELPPDSGLCPHAYHAEKLYLYDGGVLLATFDQDDDVEEVFVNGPTGRMASYYENDDDRLYFYLNDNLGSPRAVVDSTGQTQFYVYHPFGSTRYAEGNHGTQYQFTGKERDEHGYFEFDYFGARYYDPRIGSFSSIDKVGQFASGYVYGANNPVVGVDRDGNFFQLIGFALYGLYQYNQYREDGKHWLQSLYMSLSDVTKSFMTGQVSKGIADWSGSALLGKSFAGSVNSIMNRGGAVADLGIWSHDFRTGKSSWRDFSGNFGSDLRTIQGHMDFSMDYAKVMSRVDRFVWGVQEPLPEEGSPSYDELYAVTRTRADGTTRFVDVSGFGRISPWPWYKHVSPVDMGMHWLSERISNLTGSTNFRYPNGLHIINDPSKEFAFEKLTAHTDRYAPMYYLNTFNHLIFESELLKLVYGEESGYWPPWEVYENRSALSSWISTYWF